MASLRNLLTNNGPYSPEPQESKVSIVANSQKHISIYKNDIIFSKNYGSLNKRHHLPDINPEYSKQDYFQYPTYNSPPNSFSPNQPYPSNKFPLKTPSSQNPSLPPKPSSKALNFYQEPLQLPPQRKHVPSPYHNSFNDSVNDMASLALVSLKTNSSSLNIERSSSEIPRNFEIPTRDIPRKFENPTYFHENGHRQQLNNQYQPEQNKYKNIRHKIWEYNPRLRTETKSFEETRNRNSYPNHNVQPSKGKVEAEIIKSETTSTNYVENKEFLGPVGKDRRETDDFEENSETSKGKRQKTDKESEAKEVKEGKDVLLVEKQQKRLQRNRIAAKECRLRKKNYIMGLEEKVAILQGHNEQLIKKITELEKLIQQTQ
ncbi:hypothetical protein BB559_002070 [Furculomyces boomerangus]|uniref:BZIP domain-containing protein n=2 Tax=Harpellales TaxID=61421 RepID=A0A2T9YYE5_9FUNG|nr:hypothetical protein BB559_002070 [Furculomyces boomerangus]PWA00466.1 hypothetical protein BB558_003504 [Smittium angustum]